jgi:hypothetical protein
MTLMWDVTQGKLTLMLQSVGSHKPSVTKPCYISGNYNHNAVTLFITFTLVTEY